MFDKEYSFRGKHAKYVKELTGDFGPEGEYHVFGKNLEVYRLAPIIGFLYHRQGELDKETLNEEGKIDNTKIFLDQVLKIRDDVIYNYRLIMLADKKYERNIEKRLDKAFKYLGTRLEEEYFKSEEGIKDIEHFESYVLGGVEYLYEKIIYSAKNTDNIILNAVEVINQFNQRYNATIDEII